MVQRKVYGGIIIWFSILTVLEIACILLACWESWLDKDLARLRKDKEEYEKRMAARRKISQSANSAYENLSLIGAKSRRQGGSPHSLLEEIRYVH